MIKRDSKVKNIEKIDLNKLDITFEEKPIIVGGMAMEYYGLRKRGDDIDFIVANSDYIKLEKLYRNCRKDIWGDFGVKVLDFELFRSMWRFDYSYYNQGSIECEQYKIVSIDMLFRMKVFAMSAGEKHVKDVELIKEYYIQYQNKDWNDYMNENIERYLKAENGLIINGDYY